MEKGWGKGVWKGATVLSSPPQPTHAPFPCAGATPSFVQLDTLPSASSTPSSANITCYVDRETGVVTNIRQATAAACTAGGDAVVLPTAGKYITKMELAIDKQLPFVGRLAVHVRDALEAKPVVHTCGWGSGESISLFPSGNVAVRLDGMWDVVGEKAR